MNWVLPNILRQCNDIESNPGPPHTTNPNFQYKIGHVNMRSIKAPANTESNTPVSNQLTKMDLLKTEMSYFEYSILGISETWLNNTYDENKLFVQGYQKPIRRDNTSHSCGSMLYIADAIPALRKIKP